MMTKKFAEIVAYITIVLMATACFKDPEFKPAEIYINRTTLDLEKEASQSDISLLSNRNWKAEIVNPEGTLDWLRLSDTAGVASTDSVHITLSVLNNDGEDRFATVNFKTGTVYASLRVSQKGKIEHHYTPIKDVRELYKGSDVAIKEDITIKGTVISNYRSASYGGLNNSTSTKTLVISDEDAGISLFFAESNTTFAPGDIVTVKLKDLTLQRFQNGSLQVNGVPMGNITLLDKGQVPEPIAITAAQLITGEYESRYVAVSDVQVADSDLGKKFVPDKEKHSSINFVSRTNETFVLFSSKYSTYGDEIVPDGSGTLKGIAMVYGTTYQISITSKDDYAGLTGPRFTTGESGGELTGNMDITSNIAQGEKAYKYIIHTTAGDVVGLKIGTGNAAGTYTTPPLPETGSLQFSMYAVSWNGKTCALTVTVDGGGKIDDASSKTFNLRSEPNTAGTKEDAAFDFTDEDYYTATLSGITSSSTIAFSTTVEGGTRAIIAGVNVKK